MRIGMSGSNIWRARRCAASVALPRIDDDGEPSDAGRVMHKFLEVVSQRIGAGDDHDAARDFSIAAAPPHARVALAHLDTTRVDHLLGLTPELALAIDVVSGTARVLGVGLNRRYEIGPTEIPMTIDLAGAVARVGITVDWKRGWSFRAHPRENDQMLAASLALMLALGLDKVEAMLVVWRDEEVDPLVMTHTFDRFALDSYMLELEDTWGRAAEASAAIERGEPVPHVVTGDWCRYCPARSHCPAFGAIVRQALDLDFYDQDLCIRPMTPAMAAEAWRRLRGAKSLLAAIESSIYALAAQMPVPLGETERGRHRWIGKLDIEGNDKVDGDVALDVLSKRYGVEAAADVVKTVATKKDIERLAKSRARRGNKTAEYESVLDALRAANGITNKTTERVVEFTTRSADPSDDPQPE